MKFWFFMNGKDSRSWFFFFFYSLWQRSNRSMMAVGWTIYCAIWKTLKLQNRIKIGDITHQWQSSPVRILKYLAFASKLKSLASKPTSLRNCPVLGSRTALFLESYIPPRKAPSKKYIFPKNTWPKLSKPECTFPWMCTYQKLRFPEHAFARNYISPKVLLAE